MNYKYNLNRKHYQLLAGILAEGWHELSSHPASTAHHERGYLLAVQLLADKLSVTSPDYNKDKFIAASIGSDNAMRSLTVANTLDPELN